MGDLSAWAIWLIAAFVTFGVIVRPFDWPEAVWAVAGVVALLVFRLIPWTLAATGVTKGLDVYLFLLGMMTLSEIARLEGLFDAMAQWAVRQSRGSATRLFTLIYLVATLVTVFLSNDATAVVMTPAVYAAARAAGVAPLPYLYICAFVANAASFVLPISNPANLVVYASHMPSLGGWLARFALPSVLAVVVTYLILRFTQRHALGESVSADIEARPWPRHAKIAAAGLIVTAMAIMAASALGWDLGLPTFLAGLATAALLLMIKRESPMPMLRGVSWQVLPLVGGLFILVEAIASTGVIDKLSAMMNSVEAASPAQSGWLWGSSIAVLSNVTNNLPAGLMASLAIGGAKLSDTTAAAILIGVDVGPNLSITGSLATILWLIALRREGLDVKFGAFARLGLLVMPPALIAALAALIHLH